MLSHWNSWYLEPVQILQKGVCPLPKKSKRHPNLPQNKMFFFVYKLILSIKTYSCSHHPKYKLAYFVHKPSPSQYPWSENKKCLQTENNFLSTKFKKCHHKIFVFNELNAFSV